MSADKCVRIFGKLRIFNPQTAVRQGRYFSLPNEIYSLDLCSAEIALYGYLLRMENRKTYSCHPSSRTIGKALHMSRTTVMKYVRSLEDKGLIETEHTSVMTNNLIKRNGNLEYRILPIENAIELFHSKQVQNSGINRMK